MVVHRPFLFFFLLPLGLLAQYPAVDLHAVAAQQQDNAGNAPGSIEGRVTNGQSGDGISGVTIRLAPMRASRSGNAAQEAKATTAGDGSFHFDSVSPGSYFAIAEGNGFVGSGSRAALRPVSVSAGQQVANINIALTPQATISGKVIDEDGTPQVGVRVEAFNEHLIRGKMQLYRVTQATTDQAGKYSLASLPPGKYYLTAELQRKTGDTSESSKEKTQSTKTTGAAKAEEPAMEMVRTYYPKSLDFDNAGTVDVQSGQDSSGTTIQMRRVATHHLQGKVEGLSAAALQRNALFLAPRNGVQAASFGRRTRLRADGKFDFGGVVPGEYTLRLVGVDTNSAQNSRFMSRRHLLARQDVEVGASDVEGVNFAVPPPIVVTGRVIIDGVNNPNFSQVHITLAPAPDDFAYGSFQNVQAATDGTFSFENLSPAKYIVHVVGGPPGTYLKTLTGNGQDLLTQDMDLSQGGGGELIATFHTGVGEVDGTVQSSGQTSRIPLASQTGGQAASPFPMVILVPENLAPDGTGWLIGAVQAAGNFALQNVRPGRYTAFAVEHFDGNIWQNPEFLKDIRSEGISVDVGENDRRQIQLSTLSNDQIQQTLARASIQ